MDSASLGGLEVSRIGLGIMGMSALYTGAGADDAAAIGTIQHAIGVGVSHIDTAEVYGPYENELLLGRALRGRREGVTIATKLGAISHTGRAGLDGTPENVRLAVEGSLRRLGTDRIDLLYQHRIDPATPIEDTVSAMAELVQQGKVRAIGLSEPSAATIRRAHAVHPLAAVQSEYSLWTRDPEQAVLPTLRALGIGLVPYAPLGHGFLTGGIRSVAHLDAHDWRRTNPRFSGEHLARNLAIADEVVAIAADASATPAQVALAWLLAQGGDIAPIPGTTRIARVDENVAAADLRLTADQMARLDALDVAVGDRHDAADMRTLDG